MIEYNKYKLCSINYLNQIPEHWMVKRLKELGSLQNGISKGGDYFGFGFPFVSYGNIYNDNLISISGLANSSKEDQKLYSVKEGDVFFTRTSETIDEIGISSTCLVTIPNATFSGFVIRFRPVRGKLLKEYSKYFFKAHINRLFLSKEINLVTRASLSQGILNNLPVLFPPGVEQAAIAKYLDVKTQAIDKKADILNQKIIHFKELSKSLINETVYKGLIKDVPFKESGIEWIGQIPKHWQIKRLKDVASLKFSNVDKLTKEGQKEVLLCNYTDVYKNNSITSDIDFMPSTASNDEIKKFTLKKGDILITKDSETHDDIAIPALVTDNLYNVICGYHLAMIRTKGKIASAYLYYLYKSSLYNHIFARQAKGITRVGLSINSFGDALVFIPPVEEQTAIADYLDNKTKIIEVIVKNTTEQIEGLREFRKTLINDVVTGKLKVTEE